MAVAPALDRVPSRRPVWAGVILAALLAASLPSAANHVQDPGTGAPFTAQFDHDGDNEWWVEFEVRSSGGTVDIGLVQIEGSSDFHAMKVVANTPARQQEGWDKYAPEQAFNVPAGKRVMFHLGMSEAAGSKDVVISCWFTHPAGVEQCDSGSSSSSSTSSTGSSTSSTSTSSSSSTTSSTTTTTGPVSNAVVVFDHDGDNEWWVEVLVKAAPGQQVITIEARHEGDIYHHLKHIGQTGDWHKWTTDAPHEQFRIPPGQRVQFRANVVDDNMGNTQFIESCAFTHPAGVEQCAAPPPPVGSFDATFTSVAGNEWWVQAKVAANSGYNIYQVHARINGGDWKPLGQQSWGGWAASYHAPQGSTVQLRAIAGHLDQDFSDCHRWIPASGQNAQVVACPNAPPPGQWTNRTLASFSEGATDLAVADGDADGLPEVYFPTAHGMQRFSHRTGATTTISPLADYHHVAVGDGDHDFKTEVYGLRFGEESTTEVRKIWWNGNVWSSAVIYSSPQFLGPITLGDVDNDGERELYIGSSNGEQDAIVLKLQRFGTEWVATEVADFGNDGMFLDPWHFWAADADGDGRQDLVVTLGGRDYSLAGIVQNKAGQWSSARMGSLGGNGPGGIVAGDIDRDGRPEAVGTSFDGNLIEFSWTGSAWMATPVATVPGFSTSDLFLGDADNDDRPEIYASNWGGSPYQVRWTGSAWAVTPMGQVPGDMMDAIVVGDGDGDGKREVYVTTYDVDSRIGDLVRFQFQTGTPPSFDAQYSDVRGNDWWVQAKVTATQPLEKVDMRLHCGSTWRPMKLETWGSWTASFNIPAGSKVDFRATSTGGAVDFSGGYIWPQATPTGAC